MKKPLIGIAALGAVLSFSACQQSGSNQNGQSEDSITEAPAAPVALSPVTGSPEFPNATLTVDKMTAEKKGDSATVSFSFGVKNYELTQQTGDAAGKQCNNSAQGQHIHFIMDNKPYVALYKPEYTLTLPLNSDHYLMTFLSRSYHESLKNPEAAKLTHFKIDGNGKIQKLDVPSSPMVFYSRPKGDYIGKDTKNVLLDFYVYGGKLGDSLQVKANVGDTTFTLSQWQPYFIQNAAMGDLNVKLQLVDGSGNALSGPNTEVDRTAHLAADEPM
ncbi:hypothetical protein [Compostibacter hankyongensis]